MGFAAYENLYRARSRRAPRNSPGYIRLKRSLGLFPATLPAVAAALRATFPAGLSPRYCTGCSISPYCSNANQPLREATILFGG
jgi:hypothetical protein